MKTTIIFLIFLFTQQATAQWQWGQRGGGADQPLEQVSSIATDSENNIYLLAVITYNNVDIAGNPKEVFGDAVTQEDYALASFTCDGSYRWSKIIGGAGRERVNKLLIDANDNIYVSGKFANCQGNNLPSRIENDISLSDNTDESCRLSFLIKYDKDGVMQWVQYPENYTSSTLAVNQTTIQGNIIDNDGNILLLALLPTGTYFGGAFTNNLPGSHYYLLKYDTDGNFMSATFINIEHSLDMSLAIYYNPYNEQYYFTGDRKSNDSATIDGQQLGPGFFIASFDTGGGFLWKREANDPSEGYLYPYGLLFDSDNFIYFSGKMSGFGSVTFLGYTIAEQTNPSFIMKLDATAQNIIWSSNSNRVADNFGGFAMNGNELAVTNLCSRVFIWGEQSVTATPQGTPNSVSRTSLARFDKLTGACTAISFIPSPDLEYSNSGSVIAVDFTGDYIIGGRFGGTQNFLTNSNNSAGGFTDFFVAKYATTVCSLGTIDVASNEISLYPNPANHKLYVGNLPSHAQYVVCSITGYKIKEGYITQEDNGIDVTELASGTYLLRLITETDVLVLKVIIE